MAAATSRKDSVREEAANTTNLVSRGLLVELVEQLSVINKAKADRIPILCRLGKVIFGSLRGRCCEMLSLSILYAAV